MDLDVYLDLDLDVDFDVDLDLALDVLVVGTFSNMINGRKPVHVKPANVHFGRHGPSPSLGPGPSPRPGLGSGPRTPAICFVSIGVIEPCIMHVVQKTTPEQPLLIRDVRRDEIQRLYDIDQICFPAYAAYSRVELLFFLNHESSISRVAERDGKVLGFAIGQVKTNAQAHVVTIDVIPEARRGMVGHALMETMHAEFRARGAGQVSLEVDTRNDAAQQFYADLGYVRTNFQRGYY